MNVDLLPARARAKISIDPSGCWLWTGCRTGQGYGKVTFQNWYWRAHTERCAI